jgi:hypothetical protein
MPAYLPRLSLAFLFTARPTSLILFHFPFFLARGVALILMHQTRLALRIRALAYARTCFTLLSPFVFPLRHALVDHTIPYL